MRSRAQRGMGGSGTARRFEGLESRVVLGFKVRVARGFRTRLVGLALLRRERAGEGLLIPGCASVHTFGMRFALDLVFLDAAGKVVGIRTGVGQGRIVRSRAASAVLELPSAVR